MSRSARSRGSADPKKESNRFLALLEAWLDDFSANDIAILREGVFSDVPLTDAQIAKLLGLPAGYVYRLKTRAQERLFSISHHSGGVTLIQAQVRRLLNPVRSRHYLVAEIPSLGRVVRPLGRTLLAVIAKFDGAGFTVFDEWVAQPSVAAARVETKKRLTSIASSQRTLTGWDRDRALSDFGMAEAELDRWLSACRYRVVRPASKARRINLVGVKDLSRTGQRGQSTKATRTNVVWPKPKPATRAKPAGKSRRRRQGRHYATPAERARLEQNLLRDQITRILSNAGGEIDFDILMALVKAHLRITEKGVVRSAAASHPFETDNNRVRWRKDAWPQDVPVGAKMMYRSGSSWLFRVTVTSDHLDGRNVLLSDNMALAIGLKRGSSIVFKSALTTTHAIHWTRPSPRCAPISAFLERWGAVEGSTVFLRFTDDEWFEVEVPPPMPPRDAALLRALWLIGVWDTQPTNCEDALCAAASLDADAERFEIQSIYRSRGDVDVAEALERAWGAERLSHAG